MINQKRFALLWGILFLFSLFAAPLNLRAEGNFITTVKVVGYEYLLNGQLRAVSEGSGTIITNQGQVLTNAHVIMNENLNKPFDVFGICVVQNAQSYPECGFIGTLNRYDEKIDLALIDISDVVSPYTSSYPFLSYSHQYDAQDQDPVIVRGFSKSGGETLNTTQGHISGFEVYNGYTYLKTDADIDAGNSGGTMLDAEGRLVGIPTYVVGYLENSGRALAVAEAREWINSGKGVKPIKNDKASQRLSTLLLESSKAQTSGKISYNSAPGLTASAPSGWTAYQKNNDFGIVKDDEQSLVYGKIASTGFKSDKTAQEKLAFYETFYKDDFDLNFLQQNEIIDLNGKEAIHFWGQNNEGAIHKVILEHGYHTILMTYFIYNNNEATQIQQDINSFLNSVKFSSPDQDDPNPIHFLNESDYPFTISSPNDWRLIKTTESNNNLALGGRNTDYPETFSVNYWEMPQGGASFTTKQGLDNDLKNFIPEDAKVTFKSEELVLDGLPAWSYIYEYTKNNHKMKVASVNVIDPEYVFYLGYNAEETIFDDGFKDFVSILNNFKSRRYDQAPKAEWNGFVKAENQGKYSIHLLDSNTPEDKVDETPENQVNLSDIAGHRYEQSIKNLVAMGVINGNPDGTFKPEEPVNRAASLKIILESLRAKQKANGEAPFAMPADFNAFPDVAKGVWYETYVAEGLDKQIIKGYPDGTFKGEQNVNLAEALKMTLEAHGADLWVGETDPWYKKYFDASHKLNLLPADLQDPAKFITRAELAYIVDQLVSQ